VVRLAVASIRIEIHGDPEQVLAEAEIIATYAATRPGTVSSTIELGPGPLTDQDESGQRSRATYRATSQMRTVAHTIRELRATGGQIYGYPIGLKSGLSGPTIYRNLRRMVELGWLTKITEVTSIQGRARVYYAVTSVGEAALDVLDKGDRPQ
jgi:hypothetical protein